jgi:TPR repeat protein
MTRTRLFSVITLAGLLIPSPLLAADAAPKAADAPAKAAAPGEAEFKTGWDYDQGVDMPINMPQAIAWYRQAAKLGSVLAKGRLAVIYYSGNGVPVDKAEAEKFAKDIYPEIRKAAENKNAIAQLILAYMYSEGLGVARDQDAVVKWMFSAADLGLPAAEVNCGVIYEQGFGSVAKDPEQAVAWFNKAAQDGSALGQAYLGDMYRWGSGVIQNDFEAVRWYNLAAARNQIHAENALGYMYDHGRGVPCNHYAAVQLFRRAADQHDAMAQWNLGVMYENGRGVYPNLSAAVWCYRKAAAQGYADATESLRSLGYDR